MAHDHIEGLEHVSKVINITQSPIGRTPRSNPATYAQVKSPVLLPSICALQMWSRSGLSPGMRS